MKPEGLMRFSAAALALLLSFGVLTLWVPERWAVAAYQAGALLLAALWTLTLTVRPFPVDGVLPLAPLAGAALCGLVQLKAGTTVSAWETRLATLDWSVRAALFFAAVQALGAGGRRRRFVDALLYFGFAVSLVSTIQMFTSGGKIFWLFPSGYQDFVLGPFVYRNQYAAFIEMVLPVALCRAAMDRPNAFRYWTMAAVMVASVVAGASRAGTLLVFLEVLVVPLAAWGRGAMAARSVGLALAQFLVLATATTAVVGWDVVWQRFQQADPYVVRREMLESSLEMIKERPWTGFGLGTWSTAYPAYAKYDDGLFANQAHNDWAQWGVEGGLPLVGAVLVFLALLARPAWRTLWGFGVLVVPLHCLVDYPMQQRPALGGWYFAMAGAVAASAVAARRLTARGAA